MTKAILELANQLGDNLKTLTVDYGKEFAKKNRPCSAVLCARLFAT